MFDLEKSIADWQKQMSAAGIKNPVPLEELECHLREEIEQQMRTGLSVEEAFKSSVQKIGRGYVLETEFAKVDGAKESNKWERWLVVFISLGVIIPLGLYSLLKNDMSLPWRLLGFADTAAIGLAVLGCRYINKLFPVVSNKRTRTVIGLSCGLFGITGMIVFSTFILPNFELTEGQLTVIVLWGLTLMAAFCVVWAGLEEAARRQTIASDSSKEQYV